MTKFAWPLPGEGTTAEELALAQIAQAIPGLANYSGQARRDAMLAEIVAALYNAFGLPDFRYTRQGTLPVSLSSTSGSAVTIDVSTGTYFSILVNTTGGYTINAPVNLYPTNGVSQLVVVEVHNGSGGAITTSWGSNWLIAGGSWTDPGNLKSRFGIFLQLNLAMREIARSTADT